MIWCRTSGKLDRTTILKVSLGKGYPMATYDDEMIYQGLQTTAFPHVISEAPGVRRVVSVWESSRSTSSRALGLGSSRGP